jgi:WD40 repeat protein
VWDYSSGALLYSVTLGSGCFSILPYLTNDGSMRILVGSNRAPYEIKVVDHAERRLVALFPQLHRETITHILEISLPDKPVFVTTSKDGSIKTWDRGDYSLLNTFEAERDVSLWGAVPYVHPDGRQMLVCGDENGKLFLFDVAANARGHTIQSGDTSVLSLDTYTTAEGGEDRLVVGTRRGTVWLCTLPGMSRLRSLLEVGSAVRGVHVFDAPSDGRCLAATASDNRKVTIADTGDYRAPRAGGPSHLRSAVKTG